ncbi:hypothetical protein TWF225_009043 [Orbilia oligospora]|uniref:Uncharacterized protein n=1 Tax=Orbilia oligospora TaxID=2813651 RepID=A0A7C8KGM4_ORBOL|nr:hypothetical protein TWF751_006201 [Orbilia oligospora]KAF3175149.1 hypothetical protein TWF225_009043 [Orbilia oligospora]KAF3241733.1 hypothetical protein TWF128_010726 [Orbilia oligospora]KAF3248708.1 hypothetical protein TWF217_009064 [Orbilia oligospora]KAF3292583.1 hypothetical protein TWF132_005629 [Orbilia oligospora]
MLTSGHLESVGPEVLDPQHRISTGMGFFLTILARFGLDGSNPPTMLCRTAKIIKIVDLRSCVHQSHRFKEGFGIDIWLPFIRNYMRAHIPWVLSRKRDGRTGWRCIDERFLHERGARLPPLLNDLLFYL